MKKREAETSSEASRNSLPFTSITVLKMNYRLSEINGHIPGTTLTACYRTKMKNEKLFHAINYDLFN